MTASLIYIDLTFVFETASMRNCIEQLLGEVGNVKILFNFQTRKWCADSEVAGWERRTER